MKTDVDSISPGRRVRDYPAAVETGRNRRNRAALLAAGRSIGHAFSVRELCGADGHHHLVCVECGAVSTLEGCALEPLRAAAEAVGFELADRALASLPGRCARCART
jgi:hypothetical protein